MGNVSSKTSPVVSPYVKGPLMQLPIVHVWIQ